MPKAKSAAKAKSGAKAKSAAKTKSAAKARIREDPVEVECISVKVGNTWEVHCYPKSKGGVKAMLKKLKNASTKGASFDASGLPKGARLF